MSVTIQSNPIWFSLPGEGNLVQDFLSNTAWQPHGGFTMPSNKYTVTDMNVPYNAEEKFWQNKFQNPLRFWGFKMPSHTTNPQWDNGVTNQAPGGRKNYAPREEAGGLIGDGSWGNGGAPNSYQNWNFDFPAGTGYGIALLDYENNNISTAETSNRMRQGRDQCAAQGTLLGLWAQGLTTRFALQYMQSNVPQGYYSEAGAAQWVDYYHGTNAFYRVNPHVYSPDLPISCPFFYETGFYDPKLVYSLIVCHELSKIIKPSVISIPTIFIEAESVDGLTQQRFEFIRPGNPDYNRPTGFVAIHGRLQTPASIFYAQCLWSLLVCDGYYLFDTGRGAIDDLKYAWAEQLGGGSPPDAVLNYKGVNQVVRCPVKYNGFYNYAALANWQVSQTPIKEILEHTGTAWKQCEYRVSTGANVWRTGHNTSSPTTAYTFASWACLREEPLIRCKVSADGTKVLFIAQNPHNEGDETVNIRNLSGDAVTFNETITLNGAWPTWGIINI